jgi:hypothetical protein
MLEEGAWARIYIWRLANDRLANGVKNFAGELARDFAVPCRDFAGLFVGEFSGVFVGNEVVCVVRFGKQKARGKALLETAEVVFRSEDGALRLKLAFADLKSASAADGELRLETAEGPAIFQLGANAAKWCEKILHPKTRLEKLGIKANAAVSLVGDFDADFVTELRSVTKNVNVLTDNRGKAAAGADAECIFFAADSSKDLSQVAKLAKSLKGAAALWIVYPKGQKQITENDVLAAGRKCGLKDIKVVGFSATHTALKFVIPVENR